MSTKDVLAAKAQGFINTIVAMKEKERVELPTQQYGEDYNCLRAAVEKEYPQLKGLLPPAVTFEQYGAAGVTMTKSRYIEIMTYADQIGNMLATMPL